MENFSVIKHSLYRYIKEIGKALQTRALFISIKKKSSIGIKKYANMK